MMLDLLGIKLIEQGMFLIAVVRIINGTFGIVLSELWSESEDKLAVDMMKRKPIAFPMVSCLTVHIAFHSIDTNHNLINRNSAKPSKLCGVLIEIWSKLSNKGRGKVRSTLILTISWKNFHMLILFI